MSLPILVSFEAEVQRVAFDRPEKLNACTRELHALPRGASTQAECDCGIRGVLPSGAGRRSFAAQDLCESQVEAGVPHGDLAAGVDLCCKPLARRMRALPEPTRCACNGGAANIALGYRAAQGCGLIQRTLRASPSNARGAVRAVAQAVARRGLDRASARRGACVSRDAHI